MRPFGHFGVLSLADSVSQVSSRSVRGVYQFLVLYRYSVDTFICPTCHVLPYPSSTLGVPTVLMYPRSGEYFITV